MQSTKSQYSMEFLIFFAMLSIIFFVWMAFFTNINQRAFIVRDENAFNDLGKSIQSQIALASNVHSGYYSANMFIPEKVNSYQYELNTSNYVFYFRFRNQDYIYQIPYTIGTLVKGQNNKLWNLKGVVAVGNYSPVERPDGNINFTRCSDGLDNDGDGFVDGSDPECKAIIGLPPPKYIWQDDCELQPSCQGVYCPIPEVPGC